MMKRYKVEIVVVLAIVAIVVVLVIWLPSPI